MSTHRRHRSAAKPADAHWAPTFADLAALLLCFFAMLVALHEPDPERFSILRSDRGGGSGEAPLRSTQAVREAHVRLQDRLAAWSRSHASAIAPFIDTPTEREAVWIECGIGTSFAPSSSLITPELASALSELARYFPEPCASIEVGGHISNEELIAVDRSLSRGLANERANAGATLLRRSGLRAAAWSVANYGHALAPSGADPATPEGRRAARRLTLRIELSTRP